ncbi:MAG: ATP-binding cassette domain-containing protein [Myxococcota bacterium]
MKGSDSNQLAWAELMTKWTGAPFHPEPCRRAIAEIPSPEAGPEVVSTFLDRLGFGIQSLGDSANAAVNMVAKEHPVVWWDGPQQKLELWVARRRDKVRVVCPGHPPRWRQVPGPDEVSGSSAWAISPQPVIKGWPKEGPLRRLLALLRLERADLQVVLIYALVSGVLTLTTPIALQALIGTLRLGTLLQPLVVLTTLLVVALGLLAVLRALEIHLVEILQRRLMVRVVSDLSHRLVLADVEGLRAKGGPNLLNRFFDLFLIHKSLSFLLLDGLDLVLGTIIGLLLLAFYHPLLLAFDVFLMTSLFILLFFPARKGLVTGVKESKAKHRLAEWLEQLASENPVFRSSVGRRWARDRIDGYSRDYLQYRSTHFRVLMTQTIGALTLQAVASGALLGLGGWLVMQGQLTLGQLVAAELIVTTVMASVAKVGKHLETFYDLVASSDKLGQLLELDFDEGRGHVPQIQPSARLRFEDLAVVRGSRVLVSNLNLELAPGDRISIVGRSGSGKTTLAESLFEASLRGDGRIIYGDLDVQRFDKTWLRDQVAMIGDEGWLRASLRENLRMGHAVEPSELDAVLEQVGLSEAINKLPAGLETVLDPRGRPLSAIEAVRLLVARALLERPPIVIVDGVFDLLPADECEQLLGLLAAPDRITIHLTTSWERARRSPRLLNLSPSDETAEVISC